MNIKLKNFYDAVVDFNQYYTSNVKDVKTIKTHVKRLHSLLNSVLKQDKHSLLKSKGELLQIHSMLVGKVAKYYLDTDEIHSIRGVHDKLFRFLSIKQPSRALQHIPTEIFTEFVKGITYFASEDTTEHPVYHRDVSCGSKQNTIKDKHEFLLTNSNATKQAKRNAVRRCYIERVIFDIIYKTVMYEQDIGHLHELQSIERLYEHYFPNEGLYVHVTFIGAKPVKVKLISFGNIEYYIKGESNIHCVKVDEKRNVYEKTQTFQQESPWVLQSNVSYTDILESQNSARLH